MNGKKLLLLMIIATSMSVLAGAGDDAIVKILKRNFEVVTPTAILPAKSERAWNLGRRTVLMGATYLGYKSADLLQNVFKGEMTGLLARVPGDIQNIIMHKYLWAGISFYVANRMIFPHVVTDKHVMGNAEKYVSLCQTFLVATKTFNTLEELQQSINRDVTNILWADKSLIAMKNGIEYLIAQAQILLSALGEMSVASSSYFAMNYGVVDQIRLYQTNLEHNVRLINDRLAQEQAVKK